MKAIISKSVVGSLFIAISLFAISLANRINNNSISKSFEIEELKRDSILTISYEMEEIIEAIFGNQGYKLPKGISYKRIENDQNVFNFDKDGIYAYISPLSCWSCVKSIKDHLMSIENINITFIIPSKFSDDIQLFLDYIEMPVNKVYILSKDLGLPIEDTNKVFLFTVSNNDIITNVFLPTKYSKEITEAYICSILNQ